MSRRMIRREAQAWMAGWDALSDREHQALIEASPEEKFRDLAFLMASVDLFDLSTLDAEDLAARRRWARLQSMATKR